MKRVEKVIIACLGGLVALGGSAARGETAGGETAWFAHLGGFVAGMALLFLLRPRNPWGRSPGRSW